jgi:hypothetical protein
VELGFQAGWIDPTVWLQAAPPENVALALVGLQVGLEIVDGSGSSAVERLLFGGDPADV